MRAKHIEVFRGHDGQFYWRKVAANNEPTASSEGYTTHQGAFEAAERERGGNEHIPIYEVEQ